MSKRLRRREGNVYTLDASNHQVPRKTKQVKDIRPLNDAQAAYFNSINVNDLTFGVGPAGTGKAQPLDALIKTPNGWKKMGDIAVGDAVSTPDGHSGEVSAIYPQGEKDIWRITFEDGRSTECCDEHLWRVYQHDWKPDVWRVVPLSKVREQLARKSRGDRLYVQLASPEERKDVSLPINPYLLGVLIGDGCLVAGTPRFSTNDDFIAQEVMATIPSGHKVTKLKSKYEYSIRTIKGKGSKNNQIDRGLDELGLKGKRSHEKFIPKMYLDGSIAQRVELLKGLMDTDGYVDKSSSLSFCTVSESLANDFVYLVRSLGGLAKIRHKVTHYTHNGEKRQGRLAYNINIRLSNQSLAFKLPRKLERLSEEYQYKDCLRLRIKRIEYVGRKLAQCIFLDTKEHLYITNDFIVTHNTFIAAWLMAKALDEGHVERLVITRPAIEAGEKLGFLPGTEAEKWEVFFRPVRDALEEYFGKTKLEYLLKAGTIETRPIAFLRGSTLKYAFILLDEAQNLTPNQMRMVLTRLGEGSKTIVNGDPTQCDLNISVDGLTDAVDKLQGLKSVEAVHFTSDDIVRSGLVREITARYEGSTKRRRNKPIAVYAETPNDEGLKKFLGVS